MKYCSELFVTNGRAKTLKFILEPWGEELDMPADTTFILEAEAEREGSFQVEHGEDEILVWAWPSAVVRIYCKGEEVGDFAGIKRPPAPNIPEGFRMSSFVKSVLKEEFEEERGEIDDGI